MFWFESYCFKVLTVIIQLYEINIKIYICDKLKPSFIARNGKNNQGHK